MATSGGTATVPAPATGQQQKQGGPQQNKRPTRWTGSHNLGNNASSSSAASQQNARAQSPLNPTKAHSPAPGATPGQAAGNHAAAAAPFANITASPDELAKMHDRMLFLFANLVVGLFPAAQPNAPQTGHKVRCTLRSGIVYSAILSTVNDADLSVCLKLARQINPPPQAAANGDASAPGTHTLPPPKAALVVSAKDIIDIYAENVSLDAATFSSMPGASRPTSPTASANQSAMDNIMAALGGDTFRTDTDISGTGTSRDQRELKRWGMGDITGGGLEDGLEGNSSGGRGKGGAWDQFAVNERLFGTKTNYQEEIYTTRLDKSGADYKAREAKAARIAEEIQSGVALNSHVAEERGGPNSLTDDSGMDEEDKYSGVQRSQNAYVPPGARRGLPIQAPPSAAVQAQPVSTKTNGVPGSNVPQAGAPDVTAMPVAARPAPTAAAPPTSGSGTPQNKEDLVGDFKKFVTNEKEKLVQKRTQLEKQNKDKKMAELKSWSAAFVLKTPVPADLVPILSKDEIKQKELANRKPNPSAAAAVTGAAGTNAAKPASTYVSPTPQAIALTGPSISVGQKKASAWALPSIPPFDAAKAAAARAAKSAASVTVPAEEKHSTVPASTTKFNVAAKEFIFRPTAGSFVPGSGASPAPAIIPSPVPVQAVGPSLVRKLSEHVAPTNATPSIPSQPLNPFFGTRIIRNNNNAPFRVKEDFSPFKRNEKLPEPSTVQPAWGFAGKSYKVAASYLYPGTSSAGHALSPQPSHALPPHMQNNANGRLLHSVASPPPSSQPSHLSRTPSSQGPVNHASSIGTSGPSSEDGGISKSSIATPVPSSNTSASGVPTPVSLAGMQGHHQQAAVLSHQGIPGQSHMIPQGFVFQPSQQYPTFRYAPGGAGAHQQVPGHAQSGQQAHHPHMSHQQQQQLQQMQHHQQQQMHGHQLQGQPATHIVMGPNGQAMTVSAQGQILSPSGGQPMFSPQMASQMPPGQHFMQPMFVAQQGGVRGQNGHMGGGQHAPQMFYPQMQGSPAMHPQYIQMAQHPGLSMTPSQPVFEQPGQ